MREKVPRATIEKVLERYDIGKLKRFYYFRHGLDHTSAKIHTTKGKFVFRAYGKRQPFKEFVYQARVIDYLVRHRFPTAAVIRSRRGESVVRVGKQMFSVFTLVKGKHLNRKSQSACINVGKTLATLQKLLLNYRPRKKFDTWVTFKKWNRELKRMKRKDPDTYRILSPICEEMIKNLPPLLPKCKTGLIHGDFGPSNILGKSDRIIGVIDFGDIRNDYYLYDLGTAIAVFCSKPKGKGMRLNSVRSFVSGYESVRKLSAAERQALYYFVLVRIFAIGYWFWEEKNKKLKSHFMEWALGTLKSWKRQKLTPRKFEKLIWG